MKYNLYYSVSSLSLHTMQNYSVSLYTMQNYLRLESTSIVFFLTVDRSIILGIQLSELFTTSKSDRDITITSIPLTG